MIRIIFLLTCLSGFAIAQETTNSITPFQNKVSAGYTLSSGESLVTVGYGSLKQEQSAKVSSINLLDGTNTKTALGLSIQYGISSQTSINLGVSNSNTKTTIDYSKDGEALGLKDSSYESEGMTDPTFGIRQVLKENESLKAYFDLDFSPSTGKSIEAEKNKKGNQLTGGNSVAATFFIVKSLQNFEFTLAAGITNYSTRESKTTSDSSKTTGGNTTTVGLGFNFFLSPEFSFGFSYDNISEGSTTSTAKSDNSKTQTDSYSSKLFTANVKASLDKNILLVGGFVSGTSDPYNIKSDSTTINGDEIKTNGFLLGVLTYF